ncbi:MAG: ferredoxin [Bacteroidetes bacterium]|nr:ferredoxin [Bacteroidota bacterium]MBS1540123.1 ferredoxin [Bacteroidota bacterium]
MITVTLQREKCIGCNYCREYAPQRFTMSKKDGKAVLLHARDKKGFHTVRVHEEELNSILKAAKGCPVKIIKVKE